MAEITLVRQEGALTEAETNTLRSLLFRMVDGLTAVDKKRWRNWWGRWKRVEPGEFSVLKSNSPRHGAFHRRHMKIEADVFDAQERFEDFESLRYWLKVGAGFVTWAAGPKGGVVPIPKTINYADCPEEEFRQFHDDAMRFLRGPHAATYLWPHLKDGKADQMMDSVLTEFEE